MKLTGLYTALITPFDSNRKLDEEGLRFNLRFQIENNVDGIVILGTTGEAPTLTKEEKEKIIKIAVEEVKDKAALVVGTGSYSTESTIQETQIAEKLGADAALVVVPYYNKPTQEGLFRHYASICESTALPICIYNIPGRTGQNLEVNTIRRLSIFPSIVAIKESNSLAHCMELAKLIRDEGLHLSLLSGDDACTLPLMAVGGHGIISVASNLIPHAMKQLVQAIFLNDYALARDLHYRLLPFFNVCFIETNPIPIKAAMQLCGLPSGLCRLPLCEGDDKHVEKIKQVLEQLSCLQCS